ncbi:putative nuclease of the RNAse H fold HicB family [Candidatus Termititenax aidoneus]|uniref:Nuclease of the RNAse H fold HicB family n=1 Tax=Termititenax aidoneus TaxID=2218524 RepID=A0A388T9Y0_TERA1|nr:putative nuclease of the RNAse H fold HicB family [Candidatus Termititenax aidoneus]
MKYPVYIEKDKTSDYGVTVPDLPGCFSAGATIEEALDNAEEAILTHIEGLLLDDEPVPSPSEIDRLKRKYKKANYIWGLVNVNTGDLSQEVLRINISLPKSVLTKIDALASKEGESRSGFLTSAALKYIARQAVLK